ncbi:hypothetical protein [Paraburkholderia caffeinilytica]|uniref:Uncharacterized protein n=1 Tax=Paraburkholderia caffeinilytica TaxID=1761016 RepID=A0ABQ1LLD6_9BURK|nr:hypothetical protein [Paraburkholderia caffeinilytica]GGC26165.1 hypothetical protein GCM10011400_10730 [Paraburkholderia caffeinilytica]CAB3807854.1 hypothetical protein LMG28690_06910 [Paraburkholderia caffeinilytica]
MQSDNAHPETQTASSVPTTLVSPTQSEELSDDTLIDSITTLSKINGIAVVQQGARLAVIGELLASILTHLPLSMRADIAKSFRDRIESVMSLGDDRCLHEKYHSALLTEVNRYLNVLR